MRRGFTLLELLIVIIIVGIMATLGLSQYSQVVERSRGAEARQILGQMRSVCAAIYIEGENVTKCTEHDGAALGLGSSTDGKLPSTADNGCNTSHYFSYAVVGNGTTGITMTATRCTDLGKHPNKPSGGSLALWANFETGDVGWNSPNGY